MSLWSSKKSAALPSGSPFPPIKEQKTMVIEYDKRIPWCIHPNVQVHWWINKQRSNSNRLPNENINYSSFRYSFLPFIVLINSHEKTPHTQIFPLFKILLLRLVWLTFTNPFFLNITNNMEWNIWLCTSHLSIVYVDIFPASIPSEASTHLRRFPAHNGRERVI